MYTVKGLFCRACKRCIGKPERCRVVDVYDRDRMLVRRYLKLSGEPWTVDYRLRPLPKE